MRLSGVPRQLQSGGPSFWSGGSGRLRYAPPTTIPSSATSATTSSASRPTWARQRSAGVALIIALGGHEGDERARNSSMILTRRTFAARDESESLNPFKLVEAGD
jgi:hypothetical protein